MNTDANTILETMAPGKLFPHYNVDEVEKAYRTYAKSWHPDHSLDPAAGVVFSHITAMRDQAIAMIRSGTYEIPGIKRFRGDDGKDYTIKYLNSHITAVSSTYVCRSLIATHCSGARAAKAIKTINSFHFANNRMKEEMSRYLPQVKQTIRCGNDTWIIIPKTPDVLSLRDIVTKRSEVITDRHAAWIISSLYNIACYLEFAGIVHSDISIDNYYISPDHHSGLLLGGWWFSTKAGDKLEEVPKRTYDLMTPVARKQKTSSIKLSLECVKAVGRELLRGREPPEVMERWLKMPSSGTAVTDYSAWGKCLEESFGKRKFVKLKVTDSDLYGG